MSRGTSMTSSQGQRKKSSSPKIQQRNNSRGGSSNKSRQKSSNRSSSNIRQRKADSTPKQQVKSRGKMMIKKSKNKIDNNLSPLDIEDTDDEDENNEISTVNKLEPNLKGDWGNLNLLLVLYTLQGIPMGFASTVPLLMKERGMSYTLIGFFNLCSWPFSLKLLWAPFVDSCYFESIGRRKTWLLPVQMLIGIVMIILSYKFEDWIALGQNYDSPQQNNDDSNLGIYYLTASFFLLYFLCATQDIAVDGWSLTVLREENVGYQSMANAAGQTFGYAIAFIGALSFQHFNIMSFDQFLGRCGIAFIVITVAVGLFKSEKPLAADEEVESVGQVYNTVFAMSKLKTIRKMVAVLLLWKIPYVGCEAITTLKIQEKGVPKTHIAYLGGLITIFSVLVPLFVSKWSSGRRPLDLCMKLFIPRLLMCLIACAIVYNAPINLSKVAGSFPSDTFPYLYYFIIIFTSLIGCVISTAFFTSTMGMFARVSPKDIGGTYLTMLNMTSNLGSMWISPLMFKLVDVFTVKESIKNIKFNPKDKNLNDGTQQQEFVEVITIDGFYIVSIVCAVGGILAFPILNKVISDIQDQPKKLWQPELNNPKLNSYSKLKV